jgi:predicted DNA-binding transcriptional regulator YafY
MKADRDSICAAIEAMKVIEFSYKGSWRSVEPHALGYNARDKLTLCAWQLAGGSGADWRDFHVDLIADLVIRETTFDKPRPGFNPCDKTLATVICCV